MLPLKAEFTVRKGEENKPERVLKSIFKISKVTQLLILSIS